MPAARPPPRPGAAPATVAAGRGRAAGSTSPISPGAGFSTTGEAIASATRASVVSRGMGASRLSTVVSAARGCGLSKRTPAPTAVAAASGAGSATSNGAPESATSAASSFKARI